MTTRGATREPDLAPEVAARTKGLRTGWTTGTCASAAAKAAAVGLVSGTAPAEVDVGLPSGRRVSFPVESEALNRCVVVKDAGDDPDCTDGARVTAEVEWPSVGARSTDLRAGAGVGTITKPGIGLAVDAPAINPVPQRMILTALGEVTDRPLVVTFEVPGGEAMAEVGSHVGAHGHVGDAGRGVGVEHGVDDEQARPDQDAQRDQREAR